jgi:hypothetical protein
VSGTLRRRPRAEVRVLKLPDVHPDAVRIEVECPASTTGLTSVPAPLGPDMGVALLITAAVFAHEERCDGGCDTSEAHGLGSPTARQETERMYAAAQAERRRRYAQGRRN